MTHFCRSIDTPQSHTRDPLPHTRFRHIAINQSDEFSAKGIHGDLHFYPTILENYPI